MAATVTLVEKMEEISQVFSEVCSSSKLDRDRGTAKLNKQLKVFSDIQVSELKEIILRTLTSPEPTTSWEIKHGGLLATKLLLNSGILIDSDNIDFYNRIKDISVTFLSDEEGRVRTVAGEVLGDLCKTDLSTDIYMATKDRLLVLIKDHLDRPDIHDDSHVLDIEKKFSGSITKDDYKSLSPTSEKLGALDVFHDTAGWRCLETSMNALRFIVDGCGFKFVRCIDDNFLDLLFSTLHHRNRFVRETGYFLCSSIFSNCTVSDCASNLDYASENDNPILNNIKKFSEELAKGLGDNWSQVRMAASVATRSFLVNTNGEEYGDIFYPLLIPCMCLNRYYIAEGVRIYSQETWRQIAGSKGRDLVQKYIVEVVEYYVKQTKADNHAVREAACACIAELALKIDTTSVHSHVPKLLQALLICFKDDSWPVRDAACLACGNFVSAFPVECKDSMDLLYPLFYTNLEDNIPSVRQGAAFALSCVSKAYGTQALEKLIGKICEELPRVKDQPATSERYSQFDKGVATYGVVRKAMANDADLHTDRTMYSCGSLAPKMKAGGCSDHNFRRPAEAWEKSDGCVYLIAELAAQQSAASKISEILPLLAEAVQDRHYPQHINFLETVCKKLPDIASGIGKKLFKPKLELFFDAIFYGLSCESALTATAASQCLSQLATYLGPNILRGRVEMYNSSYLEPLNANIYSAAL